MRVVTKEIMEERIQKHQNWECPECGSKLEEAYAKKLHSGYSPLDRARKCTNCEYWGVGSEDWNYFDVPYRAI